MRNDTTIQAAGLTITLTGETRTFASVTIDGREYTGEIGSRIDCNAPDQWISWELLEGMYRLNSNDFTEVCDALSGAMQ